MWKKLTKMNSASKIWEKRINFWKWEKQDRKRKANTENAVWNEREAVFFPIDNLTLTILVYIAEPIATETNKILLIITVMIQIWNLVFRECEFGEETNEKKVKKSGREYFFIN